LIVTAYGHCFAVGAVHKVRHARGEGVREGVTIYDRGSGVQEHVTSHFLKKFHTYET